MRRLLATAAALGLLLSACSSGDRVDLVADAGDTPAPPADARLADAGYEEAAAWVRDELDRTGRPVIVKFFASWCLPCAEEAPILLAVADEHPEVAVLGIDHQDPRDPAEAWIDEHGFDRIPTVADLEGEVARALGARGMPSVSFIDDEGVLAHTHTGPIEPTLLEEWVDHLAHDGPRPDARPAEPWTEGGP